jgi:hypothetical protein
LEGPVSGRVEVRRETEKKLAAALNEAGQSDLFLDEADLLFGGRTNATHAHDRYANVEQTISCS